MSVPIHSPPPPLLPLPMPPSQGHARASPAHRTLAQRFQALPCARLPAGLDPFDEDSLVDIAQATADTISDVRLHTVPCRLCAPVCVEAQSCLPNGLSVLRVI